MPLSKTLWVCKPSLYPSKSPYFPPNLWFLGTIHTPSLPNCISPNLRIFTASIHSRKQDSFRKTILSTCPVDRKGDFLAASSTECPFISSRIVSFLIRFSHSKCRKLNSNLNKRSIIGGNNKKVERGQIMLIMLRHDLLFLKIESVPTENESIGRFQHTALTKS